MIETVPAGASTEVQALSAPVPWQAWLFRLPGFPVPEEDLDLYRSAILLFTERVTDLYRGNRGLALQLWKMSGKHGGDVLQQHMGRWPSELGFGVWPNRPAATGWTDESIQNAAAAVYRGDEPTLPMHRMLLFKMDANDVYQDALAKMSGFGMAVQFFSRNPIAELKKRGREEFLPGIADARFRGGRVYLPVLDAESLRAAGNAAQLDRWLCGTDVYVRESAEDRSLLVIARQPGDTLNKALDELSTNLAPLQTAAL